MQKPRPLKRGDHVAIVSLSSGVLGETFTKHQLKLGCQRLTSFGLHPVIMPNALRGITYLQNHPEKRAEDLKTAFFDDQIAGIICAIGGDDTYRLLPNLMDDPEFIAQVKRTPKLFTGFSDTTINHLMFYQLGMTTFYGPNFLNDLAELDHTMLPYTKQTFAHFFQNSQTTPITSSPQWYDERTDFSPTVLNTARDSHPEKTGYRVLRGSGRISGKLLGGCLDSFYDLLSGTRYDDEAAVAEKYHLFPSVEQWRGKLLFIETSEERPNPQLYEKMLLALKERGVFSAVNGILVGKPQNQVYFDDYQAKLLNATQEDNLPILYNVNFGHAYPRTTIPYGLDCTVDLDQKTITVQEPFFQGPLF